jgi:alpha-amylase
MATKFFSDGSVHAYFNPYETPYDAFMNYMNVLSDFEIRLNKLFPDTAEQGQIIKLSEELAQKELLLAKQAIEIRKMEKKIGKPKAVTPVKKTTVKKKVTASKKVEKKPVKKTAVAGKKPKSQKTT